MHINFSIYLWKSKAIYSLSPSLSLPQTHAQVVASYEIRLDMTQGLRETGSSKWASGQTHGSWMQGEKAWFINGWIGEKEKVLDLVHLDNPSLVSSNSERCKVPVVEMWHSDAPAIGRQEWRMINHLHDFWWRWILYAYMHLHAGW